MERRAFGLGMIAFPAAHGPRWLVLVILAANEVVVGPALWVAAVGATTTVLWTWFSPLRDRERSGV